MKIIKYTVGTAMMVFLLFAMLIGIVEITIFGGRSFYREQYEKLEVAREVSMEMDDLMEVTDEMLDYLQDKREDLVVVTTIAGEKREFFNEREKLHMEDVKGLNLGAVRAGRVSLIIFLILFVLFTLRLIAGQRGAGSTAEPVASAPESGAKIGSAGNIFSVYLKCFLFAILFILLVVGIGALIVSTDFERYWTMFHEIVFTNDLWLLDPNTDLLINIVPEDFFIALVSRCAATYALVLGLLAVVLLGGWFIFRQMKKGKKKAAVVVAVLLALVGTLPGSRVSAGENDASYREAQELLQKIPTSAPWPEAPVLSSASAILIEENSGKILFQKNALDPQEPADLNKLMTAYLTLTRAAETARTDIVTYPQSVIYTVKKGDTYIGLKTNEVLTVYDSLCGLLLPSADDCAAGLAHFVNAKTADFVSAMNMSAMLMNFANTNYKAPGGRPVEGQYTCAYDVAKLYEELLTYPIFVEISRKTTYTIDETNITKEKRPIKNKQRMLFKDDKYYDSRVICGKNGRGNTDSDQSLVTFARSGDVSLLCVVMGADPEGQYADTKKLLDYGFNEFENVNISANDSRFYQSASDTGILTAGSQLQFYRFDAKASLLLPKNTSINDLTTTVIRSMNSSYSMIRYYIGEYFLGEAQVLEASPALADVKSPLFSDAGGMLPYKALPPMERAKEGLPWYLIPAVAAGILLVIIFICAYNSKANKRRRRHRRTKIVKNITDR